MIATDAACEGLNLQTLGTLINVDLPWNPGRLEQRLGRIKRFGQARRTVDMLNLVYHDTQDEEVYQVISRRLKDKFDIFGGLPDTIEDDWIESVERLETMMDQFIHLRQKARDVFELRYKETIDPDKNRWELCSRVLARKRRRRKGPGALETEKPQGFPSVFIPYPPYTSKPGVQVRVLFEACGRRPGNRPTGGRDALRGAERAAARLGGPPEERECGGGAHGGGGFQFQRFFSGVPSFPFFVLNLIPDRLPGPGGGLGGVKPLYPSQLSRLSGPFFFSFLLRGRSKLTVWS